MKKYGVDIKWLAVTSFEMKFGNTTVVSDPYITDCVGTELDYTAVEKCDIITLTHSHYDHITDIPRLVEKFNPIVMCGELTATPLARWLNCPAMRVYPMNANLELDFNDVKIKALFGRHKLQNAGARDRYEQLSALPKYENEPYALALADVGSMEYRNYLFTAKNGTRILLWGNDPTPEQLNICKDINPDIAIMQRTISQEKHEIMADFIKRIGCKVVIPHHHDFKGVDDPSVVRGLKEAIKRAAPEIEFITPRHGEWISL